MEALQLLKFSIRKGPVLNFTEGLSWTEELKEFEYMAWTAPSEDPDTYNRNLAVKDLDDDKLDEIIEDMTRDIQGINASGSEEDTGNSEDSDDEWMKESIVSYCTITSYVPICICI